MKSAWFVDMKLPTKHILAAMPDASAGEVFESLVEHNGVRIERIVSHGQATPVGEWYDQPSDEWVMIVQGHAGLLLEGETEPRALGPGDHLFLPAGCPHRVAWTSSDGPTVWLAVHWRSDS